MLLEISGCNFLEVRISLRNASPFVSLLNPGLLRSGGLPFHMHTLRTLFSHSQNKQGTQGGNIEGLQITDQVDE